MYKGSMFVSELNNYIPPPYRASKSTSFHIFVLKYDENYQFNFQNSGSITTSFRLELALNLFDENYQFNLKIMYSYNSSRGSLKLLRQCSCKGSVFE